MDRNGFIWSSKPLLRWDTSKPLNGTNGEPLDPALGHLHRVQTGRARTISIAMVCALTALAMFGTQHLIHTL